MPKAALLGRNLFQCTQKAEICSHACSHALLGLFASLHWFERMAKSHVMIRLRCKLQKKRFILRTWENIPEDDFLVEPLQVS